MLIFSPPQVISQPPDGGHAEALVTSGALVWGAPALPSMDVHLAGFDFARADQVANVAKAQAKLIVATYSAPKSEPSSPAPAPPAPSNPPQKTGKCLKWQVGGGGKFCVKYDTDDGSVSASGEISLLVQISGVSINDDVYEKTLTSMGAQWADSFFVLNGKKDNLSAQEISRVQTLVNKADAFLRILIESNPGLPWPIILMRMTYLPWNGIPWPVVNWTWFRDVGRKWSVADWKMVSEWVGKLGPFALYPKQISYVVPWEEDSVWPNLPMKSVYKKDGTTKTLSGPTWSSLGETWNMPWEDIPFLTLDFNLGYTFSLVNKSFPSKVKNLLTMEDGSAVTRPEQLIRNAYLAYMEKTKKCSMGLVMDEATGQCICAKGTTYDNQKLYCVPDGTTGDGALPAPPAPPVKISQEECAKKGGSWNPMSGLCTGGSTVSNKNKKTNRGRGFDFSDDDDGAPTIDRNKIGRRGREIDPSRRIDTRDRGEEEATPPCPTGKVKDPVVGTCISPDEMAIRKACRDAGNTFILGKGCVAGGGGSSDDADDEEEKKSSTGLLLGVGLLAAAAVGAAYVLTRPPSPPPPPPPEEPAP